MLGITLMAIGNLLPRTRPNLALGIRTARTLMDRQLWVLTHRISGYVLVGVGIVTVISGLSMSGPLVPAAPGLAVLAGALIVTAYTCASRGPDGGAPARGHHVLCAQPQQTLRHTPRARRCLV
jgi:uncharacterized membrane protein